MPDMIDPNLLAPGEDSRTPRVPPLNTITKPEPVINTGVEKHYYSVMAHVSMHRRDGTRLAFIHHHFSTTFKADQEFLDAEIDGGHPHIFHATPEQIQAAMMRKFPKETMRKQVEAEVRGELESKIKAQLAEKLKIQPGSAEAAILDGIKVAETDVSSRLKTLAAGKTSVESGSGRLIIDRATPAVAPIRPVSTAEVSDAVANSGK